MKKIDTLDPEFQVKVELLLQQLPAVTGVKWVVTDARRTMAEQQHLFDLGRTLPGKVVTKAKPGSSAHNYGLAVDLCPIDPKDGDLWWDAPDAKWRAMADHAHTFGLVAGYYFKSFFDAPHIEDPNWRLARAEWQAGKLEVA